MSKKKLVITHLIGGLGNQMFQYAAGLSLASRTNSTLKLDTSDFETYKLHEYSLGNWNISAESASRDEIKFLKTRKFFILKSKKFSESGLQYNPALFKQEPPVYISGYWQTEKYFKTIRNSLLQEFVPKKTISTYSQSVLNQITSSSCSVSLHVRRGDYLLSQNQKIHGVCGLDYYEAAIELLEKSHNDITFFVFSDDILWAKDNLKISSKKIWVDGNDSSRNFEDIHLMSKCSHNIIANSSFSWWGAWLNNNQDKKVIAPKAWFQSPKMDIRDLCCPEWILL